MSEPRSNPSAVRVSDADRERVISELSGHTAAGRLTTDELEERLRAAYAARTRGELEALATDLPPSPETTALELAERRRHLSRRMIQETGGALSLFAVCTAIWLVAGAHHGQFWPIWVLIAVVGSLVRNGWALYGPAPDLDSVERHLDSRGRRSGRAGRRRHLDR